MLLEKNKKILITGGAGYIGSHIANSLNKDHEIVVVDNLSSGFESALDNVRLEVFDLLDSKKLEQLLRIEKFDTCIHLAGSLSIEESYIEPDKYFENNTRLTNQLVDMCKEFSVRNFLFSSTAAVYNTEKETIFSEESSVAPLSPYGKSKLLSEEYISSASNSDFRYIIFRYFNVYGGNFKQFKNRTSLIDSIYKVISGECEELIINGNDYPTHDGTCIRDYIHIDGIVSAHNKALDYLSNGGASEIINLGSGKGMSVLEVIQNVEKIENCIVPHRIGERREGDTAVALADSRKAYNLLDWCYDTFGTFKNLKIF